MRARPLPQGGTPPLITAPVDITLSELHVSTHAVFEAAGMRRIAQPGERSLVMRINL